MDSFRRFGIDHLSPSALNLWVSAPGLYALRYIAKIKDGGGPAMWRGTGVENGLAALLHGRSVQQAYDAAHQSYDLNCKSGIADAVDIEAEGELISGMIDQCALWKPPSALNATQIRVEYYFDPIPVPVIGFVDFAFEGHDIDLKTTKAIPSSPRPEHARQVSLYRAARNRTGGLLYVSAKRHLYHEVTDEMMNESLAELKAAALSLNNFLARCDGRDDALKSLPIDYGHYAAPKTRIPLAEILLAG